MWCEQNSHSCEQVNKNFDRVRKTQRNPKTSKQKIVFFCKGWNAWCTRVKKTTKKNTPDTKKVKNVAPALTRSKNVFLASLHSDLKFWLLWIQFASKGSCDASWFKPIFVLLYLFTLLYFSFLPLGIESQPLDIFFNLYPVTFFTFVIVLILL